nr:FkbM family methyltransferase [Undibacter mobilis]
MPTVVDVGARNGMWTFPESYTRHACLIGFEPNPVEFEKLNAGRSDAEIYLASRGQARPVFKKEVYHPYALWDREEQRPLYITKGAGAATLMGDVHPKMKDHFQVHEGGASTRSVYDTHYQIESTEALACRTLDSLIPVGDKIDFLKLDVEGAEMRVLAGAAELLRRRAVLFVETEFQTFAYYAEHPLLGHQHAFLADRGFRLLDLQLNHARQRRGRSTLPAHNDRVPMAAGDAYLCLDPDNEPALQPLDLHRVAALSLALGFASWGLSLLRQAGLLAEQQISNIENEIRMRPLGRRRQLVNLWNAVPFAVDRMTARLRK